MINVFTAFFFLSTWIFLELKKEKKNYGKECQIDRPKPIWGFSLLAFLFGDLFFGLTGLT